MPADLATDAMNVPEPPLPPSKTRRKAAMHALQDLGEALVALDPRRLDDLAAEVGLPERLVEAVRAAAGSTPGRRAIPKTPRTSTRSSAGASACWRNPRRSMRSRSITRRSTGRGSGR